VQWRHTSAHHKNQLAAEVAGLAHFMRGHGFAAAARSLIDVVRMSVYLPRNARVLLKALPLGKVKPLSRGEIEARTSGYKPESPETQRAWRYWATRAGCAELLD